MGGWTGVGSGGGLLAVENAGQTSFEIGVSSGGAYFHLRDFLVLDESIFWIQIDSFPAAPLHQHLEDLPFLGDTTSNQALLFSPSFAPAPSEQPSWPQYTLPSANLSAPVAPSSSNFTLLISPTSSNLAAVPQTGCRLRTTLSSGNQQGGGSWLLDGNGWRQQWLVDGLSPATNYTVFVIENNTTVSGPINIVTKSAAFPCALVHSLPYCPSISYAVPLVAPPSPAVAYDATTLPGNISSTILEYMTNFTTTLSTFPCGRDMYSPLQTCADCQTAYRKWLCSVSFPRCSEESPSTSQSSQSPAVSALVPQPANTTQRNPAIPPLQTDYTSLLPCLETCNAVDRACPNFLGFKCPVVRFNADKSYGVGFVDSGEVGVQGQGSTGSAQDRWGNVWCNGS
ncbi:hypothetical protein HWV62_24051 [Athelia sp. TMB]|nr:hypothetical protein HWV62_24051 [Athelia sp. TMB]